MNSENNLNANVKPTTMDPHEARCWVTMIIAGVFVFFAGCDVMNTQERERTRRQALSQGLCERVDRGPNGIATTAWQPCACAPSSTSSKED